MASPSPWPVRALLFNALRFERSTDGTTLTYPLALR